MAGSLSLYDLEKSAGVFDSLDQWLDNTGDLDLYSLVYIEKDIRVQLLARNRYKWDVFCERYPSLPTAIAFFNQLKKLRPLFYPLDVALNFPDSLTGHDPDEYTF